MALEQLDGPVRAAVVVVVVVLVVVVVDVVVGLGELSQELLVQPVRKLIALDPGLAVCGFAEA